VTLTALQKEAAALPESERAQLIDFLWDSLAPEELQQREKAWAGEAERRAQAVEEGRLTTRDAGEVLAELRRLVRK
jgi:putative addiction module component (TIGR02574 family)